MSKGALGSGESRGQTLHALGIRKRPHADNPLGNRGLLFCTVLGSPRQRASMHTRTQPGKAARKRPLGARKGQRGDSQQSLRWFDVIIGRRKCCGRRGATCGAQSRLMLRKFPSLELSSVLAGRFRAVQRKAGLPCRQEPSVETLGKGLRGIRARRWLLSPAGARLLEAVAFTLGDGEKTISGPSCVRIRGLLLLHTLSCILRENRALQNGSIC